LQHSGEIAITIKRRNEKKRKKREGKRKMGQRKKKRGKRTEKKRQPTTLESCSHDEILNG